MALDVDWAGTATNPYRIFIPRADMPIVQASPEIRELDIDVFRKDLRTLEAAQPGAPWPETHRHVTETTLSGFTYARIVEILAPYQVEFEDGQYSVRTVGANHNVLDVKVNNQVSLAVQNSAGLINSAEIQFSSFENAVAIDTTSAVTGTSYPNGTRRQPVNNLVDALAIATARGLTSFYVLSDLTIGGGVNVAGYAFFGANHHMVVTVDASANVAECGFNNMTLTGTFDGAAHIRDCFCVDLTNVHGHLTDSSIEGTIALSGAGTLQLVNCWDGTAGLGIPVVDCNGAGSELNVRNYRGALQIENKTGPEGVSIDYVGRVVLAATVTNGEFVIRSSAGSLVNNATGITLSSVINSPQTIAGGVLDEAVANHLQVGSTGKTLIELFQLLGLDPTKPLVVEQTRRYVGPPSSPDVDQTISVNAGVVTVTRQ